VLLFHHFMQIFFDHVGAVAVLMMLLMMMLV